VDAPEVDAAREPGVAPEAGEPAGLGTLSPRADEERIVLPGERQEPRDRLPGQLGQTADLVVAARRRQRPRETASPTLLAHGGIIAA
jgi:hypothetical protein